jgi:hypothetical protein
MGTLFEIRACSGRKQCCVSNQFKITTTSTPPPPIEAPQERRRQYQCLYFPLPKSRQLANPNFYPKLILESLKIPITCRDKYHQPRIGPSFSPCFSICTTYRITSLLPLCAVMHHHHHIHTHPTPVPLPSPLTFSAPLDRPRSPRNAPPRGLPENPTLRRREKKGARTLRRNTSMRSIFVLFRFWLRCHTAFGERNVA